MDDNGKEKRKQALKERAKEHRQWLESMKVKQMVISKKLSDKRIDNLRRSVIRKAEKALYNGCLNERESHKLDVSEDVQGKSDEKIKDEENQNKVGSELLSEFKVSSEKQRQRFFAKHLNLTAEYPKTASEVIL